MSQLVLWEVPKSDLVPIILTYRRDKQLCMCILKILVALTLPVTRSFNNVYEHLAKLQVCKELFIRSEIMAILMGFLAEPLSKRPEDRTDDDTSVVDAMLHLFHNLLHIRTLQSVGAVDDTRSLLDDALLQVFFRENVMDALVVVAQNIDHESNRMWTLLLTNTLFLIIDGLVPEDLAFSFFSKQSATARVSENVSALKALRTKEKQAAKEDKFRLSGRHSRFGGSLQTKDSVGTTKYVDARQLVAPVKLAPRVAPQARAPPAWERMDRIVSSESKCALFEYLDRLVQSNVFSLMMHEATTTISETDLENTFLPSFQADVNRYIRLIGWFTRFDYVRQVQTIRLSENPNDVRREHPILDTVPTNPDKQTFKLDCIGTVFNPVSVAYLLKRSDHLYDQKPFPYRDVYYVYRTLADILNTCGYILCNGTRELRFQSKKILYQIFLDRKQFLDRLPNLLERVALSKMPRHYLVSLVLLVDLTFILIEKIEEIDNSLLVMKKQRKKKAHSVASDRQYEGDEQSEEGDYMEEGDVSAPKKSKREEERFNDFNELQTQEFRISDYIRKFQHNKVIAVCMALLEDFEKNTEETNTAIFRLFERIRTGAGDSNAKLPAIFCLMRLLFLFSRIMQYTLMHGSETRPSIRLLNDFATNIVELIIRMTGKGANGHVFPALLFWRSHSENLNFEDLNLRLAYEEGLLHDDDNNNDSWSENDGRVVADEPDFQDDEILLDAEAIAASNRADEERKAALAKLKKNMPKKAKTAFKFFCKEFRDMVQQDNPEATRAQVDKLLQEKWDATPDEEKSTFEAREREDRDRYDQELASWKPPSESRKKGKKRISKRLRERQDQEMLMEEIEARGVERRAAAIESPRLVDEEPAHDNNSSSSSEDVPLGQLAASLNSSKKKRK